ncbi:MAG: TIGR02281 family clan AA aspartic protease [Burkholderiales bacterium]|nr:TIGR02281 family clan AA aspartic protease [Burkholderiales bacterium]
MGRNPSTDVAASDYLSRKEHVLNTTLTQQPRSWRILRRLLSLFPFLCLPFAHAAEISVIGVFPGKAVLVIDGAQPKTYSVGANLAGGAKLISVDNNGAVIESNGRRETLGVGQHMQPLRNVRAKVVLQADVNGHVVTQVNINGGGTRMILDTGATLVALPASEARRLNIKYQNGQTAFLNTANGRSQGYVVKLDSVRIGDLQLDGVDAVVVENGLNVGLLGMSFLNRTDMHREGREVTLIKN